MLKGKIDKDGWLWIGRPIKLEEQYCRNDCEVRCGKWCPQFGEPERRELCDPMGYLSKEIYLKICEQCILEFDELIDERPKVRSFLICGRRLKKNKTISIPTCVRRLDLIEN